jgi:cytochrome P450
VAAVSYDPYSPEVMSDPYPIYRELRAHHPVYRLDEYDAWALSRFEDAWQVAQDREHFSIVEGPVFARPRMLTRNDGAPDARVTTPVRSFSMIDPPDHTALRKSMFPPFTPRATAPLEAEVRAVARRVVAPLAARGHFDVHRDYAAPVAATVMFRILGLPEADRPHLVSLANRFVRRDPGQPGITAEGVAAHEELQRYLVAFVEDQRAGGRGPARPGPGDTPGIVERLSTLELEIDGEVRCLTPAEVAVQLTTLLVGGIETVPKIIAGGAIQLSEHPDQRAALVADPTLAPMAHEELVRHQTVLQFVGRTLVRDAVVAGQPMAAGQRVLLLLISANRDEREFPDPDAFRIDRAPVRHLGFGHGVHFCIGAHTARLEGVVLLQELLAAVPEFEVDRDHLERLPSEFQLGYTSVPIHFDPRSETP